MKEACFVWGFYFSKHVGFIFRNMLIYFSKIFRLIYFSKIFRRATPRIVAQMDANIDGRIMLAGFWLPLDSLSEIIVVGRICRLVAFRMNSMSIFFVAVVVEFVDIFDFEISVFISVFISDVLIFFCISLIAEIAMGVAALPIPSRFAEILRQISFCVFADSPGKSLEIHGERNLWVFGKIGVADRICMIPIQKAYIPARLAESANAFWLAVCTADSSVLGEAGQARKVEITIKIAKRMFMSPPKDKILLFYVYFFKQMRYNYKVKNQHIINIRYKSLEYEKNGFE